MITIKKTIIYCLLCFLALGCSKDFLELAPISNANANNVFKTKADFELAVNAAFTSLYDFYGPLSGVSYCAEQMSDNGTMSHTTGAVNDKWAFKNYTLQPSNTMVYEFWKKDYSALFNANIVLEKIEGTSLDNDYKTSVKAQMMFLRALYYFNMVQMWGDLPLVTKPITNFEESYNVLRSPSSEVYNLIKEDLNYCVEHLPLIANVSAPGKPTKGAAQTLLGKIHLTLGDKTAAKQILLEVYNRHEYELLPTYQELWVLGNKNTKESIFEVQYKGGTGNPYSIYYPAYAPFENFTLTAYSEGMNLITDDLYNEFETGDARREQTGTLGYYNKKNEFIEVKFQNKWVDKTVTYGSEYCDNNFMVLRYADLLLMLSEATGEASYLNEVRKRANLPLFGDVAYPSNLYPTIDLAIEHERRVELALEFHRWFDLKRTGRAIPVLTAKKGKAVTKDMLVLPIPEKVRQQNPNISQNAAYLN